MTNKKILLKNIAIGTLIMASMTACSFSKSTKTEDIGLVEETQENAEIFDDNTEEVDEAEGEIIATYDDNMDYSEFEQETTVDEDGNPILNGYKLVDGKKEEQDADIVILEEKEIDENEINPEESIQTDTEETQSKAEESSDIVE